MGLKNLVSHVRFSIGMKPHFAENTKCDSVLDPIMVSFQPQIAAMKSPTSPVLKLHKLWMLPGRGGMKSIDLGPIEIEFHVFIDWLCSQTHCIDLCHSPKLTKCTCVNEINLAEEERKMVFGFLMMEGQALSRYLI